MCMHKMCTGGVTEALLVLSKIQVKQLLYATSYRTNSMQWPDSMQRH